MLSMSQINYIKDLKSCGCRISEISKKSGVDPKTVRKYLAQDDFSPAPPVKQTKPSILDPYKPVIQEWLEEDKKQWHKQQHTAKRIFDCLTEEEGYTGSYSIVQRYVKKYRAQSVSKANQELIWEPGPARVDFGEADVYESGNKKRMKYLTVSFQYSNDAYCQFFGGEAAECVCQGLQDIFGFIGGVPPLLIFDNATGVGRRVGEVIHESELFSRFRAHYHFRVRFCNPDSGWEKRNVEAKVNYERDNLFVPVIEVVEIDKHVPGELLTAKIEAKECIYMFPSTLRDEYRNVIENYKILYYECLNKSKNAERDYDQAFQSMLKDLSVDPEKIIHL